MFKIFIFTERSDTSNSAWSVYDWVCRCLISLLPLEVVVQFCLPFVLYQHLHSSGICCFREFAAENLQDCKGFLEAWFSVRSDLCIVSSLWTQTSTGVDTRKSVPVLAATNCFICFKPFKERLNEIKGCNHSFVNFCGVGNYSSLPWKLMVWYL